MANKSFQAILIALVLTCTTTICISDPAPSLSYDVIYSWKDVDFAFKSPEHKAEALKTGAFISENTAASGLKVGGDRIFVTVPRWFTGIPASLAYVPYNRSMKTQANPEALLTPYISWEFHEEGNCAVLQYAQSMEIDQFNRMWIADVGRRNIFDKTPDNTCPPKMILIDMETDKVLHTHEFPAEVVGRTSSFLNDLVIGCSSDTDCMVYISDATDAKIIVYDFSTDKSWYIQHPSMKADPKALIIPILGKDYNFDIAADGIALSNVDRNFDTLYYCALSGVDVFAVSTETIKQAGASKTNGVQLKDSDVMHVGKKASQTDGMTIGANGILYYGALGNNAIMGWNISEGKMTDGNQMVVSQNDEELQWPDTFSIDSAGYLFATPNRLHRHFTHTYDFKDVNFRIVRFFINAKSYMYSMSDTLT